MKNLKKSLKNKLKKSLKNKLKKRKTLRRRKYNGGAAASVSFYSLTQDEQEQIIEKQKQLANKILKPPTEISKLDLALRIVNFILAPNPHMYTIANSIVPFMDTTFIKECESILNSPNLFNINQRNTLIALINEKNRSVLSGKPIIHM
jgi:hypothetical protein